MTPKRRREGEEHTQDQLISPPRRSSRLAKSEPSPAAAVVKKPKRSAVKAQSSSTAKEEAKTTDEKNNKGKAKTAAVAPKTVIIEHCKQCNSFKTRAIQVKAGLEEGVSGITVVLNPDKPRRGCFEIREEGGETFISLLNMKRPFKPMKDLDMEKVIADIIEKLHP